MDGSLDGKSSENRRHVCRRRFFSFWWLHHHPNSRTVRRIFWQSKTDGHFDYPSRPGIFAFSHSSYFIAVWRSQEIDFSTTNNNNKNVFQSMPLRSMDAIQGDKARIKILVGSPCGCYRCQ
mmetsp:Transcript_10631/g.30362  ORF Transcript_10631/g.30362 Transcript_10631/m.30362 type:complete len:121 (-) Transcript_10631:103-465(-)